MFGITAAAFAFLVVLVALLIFTVLDLNQTIAEYDRQINKLKRDIANHELEQHYDDYQG